MRSTKLSPRSAWLGSSVGIDGALPFSLTTLQAQSRASSAAQLAPLLQVLPDKRVQPMTRS